MLEVLLDELCKRIRNLDFALIRPIQARLISSVAFVAFVAFWGTTMLFFKKFKLRAFRKVYGSWGYSLPLETYMRLKFG